jgi:hypothetical protein
MTFLITKSRLLSTLPHTVLLALLQNASSGDVPSFCFDLCFPRVCILSEIPPDVLTDSLPVSLHLSNDALSTRHLDTIRQVHARNDYYVCYWAE